MTPDRHLARLFCLRVVSALAVLFMATQPILAQTTPLEITADTFTIDEGSGVATFSGNVEMNRATMTLWAAEVVVTYGTDGEGDVDRVTAAGNVRIKTSSQTARGERADYDPDMQILKLMDNVSVTNPQGTVEGPLLVINLKTDVSTFSSSGGNGSRVTGVFTPQ